MGAQEAQGWDNTSTSPYADETLVEDTLSSNGDQIDIKDWSELDRGSHIDFGDEETLPIVQDVALESEKEKRSKY
ncbi:uncharacterized protein J4E88_002296 [Alternaria novae-zelandiae]|uniref:uncharacterized protein n=1 Tax=Alternaria novae-zelandiae TaxID=430562 RepID=UPI0020C2EF3B|nr:uncharacterized protein J4E88_002296 [Alternaria novae-zelandiae]KAI4690823.1 hypothetical protein J4E88_002296 [Alternaria novae-zelandiae]